MGSLGKDGASNRSAVRIATRRRVSSTAAIDAKNTGSMDLEASAQGASLSSNIAVGAMRFITGAGVGLPSLTATTCTLRNVF